ncbi:SDR family oxidoreductase [Psychrobacter sp. 16-MNA-CIBAN-0192]|uniref:SDR family NAD(P)-dependent oxidoreductase n=1 Tax=Psychrobacter sp. 16-MNA-CIBAN-0192 TaxID=3140448 RepID=UPI0033254C1C
MKRFKEKTVIVTGAGSGIGRATAIRFAREGANVVLVGRTTQTLEETASEFPHDRTWIHTDNYLIVACDVSIQTQVKEMIKLVIDKFDKIDILVNNAGKAVQGKITELSAEEWKSAIDINLNGTFYVCQTAMPYLIASKGNIINVSSLSGMGGDWNMAAYNAAKAGVSNLTRTLALDHGADGVRINAVNPSVTKTGMSSSIQEDTVKTDKFIERCPMGRFATPEDVAAAITFLASDEAAMITGVNLPVDGGVSASSGQPRF